MMKACIPAWLFLTLIVCHEAVEEELDKENQDIPGHLQVLGKHRPPEGHIEILHTLPSPEEFWEKYARDGIPVLFRGMANNSLGTRLWTDEYLDRNYGDLRVKIEAKAEKEDYPEGDRGIGQDTLRYFLDTYRSRNAYVVSQLPDPMSAEVSVPPFMTCGTFGQRLLEANLWFSSGGTKSLLHRDADNAINCLFFGTKDWIFIHPAHEDKIPIGKEETQGYGGYAVLNPDLVDLQSFPAVADIPWTYGNVTAGDCIFLPRGYWHQVRSYGSRNLAVSLLFSRIMETDLSDCEGASLSYKPLSEMEMVFTYDGYGEQTMGDTDPYELNDTFREWCQQSGCSLDKQALIEGLLREYSSADEDEVDPLTIPDADIIQDTAQQIIETVDKDEDEKISCQEMDGLKLTTLKKLANIMAHDPANTEEFEYATFEPQTIRELMAAIVKKHRSGGEEFISRQDFIDAYHEIGGSRKIGSEMFSKVQSSGRPSVSIVDLEENSEDISALFSRKMKHDHGDERWVQEEPEWKTNDAPHSSHLHTDL